MLNKLKIFVLLLIISSSSYAKSEPMRDVEKIRKAIVTINSRVPVSAYQNTGSWSGTGFIVDAKNGLIVTNAHVVGRASVGTYFLTFHNGQQAEAKLVYYDQYCDFAVLKINIADLPQEYEIIEFTDVKPKIGEELYMVGNTEGQGFSFHTGYMSDLYEIYGEMPQGSYTINMNSTGGASGSPVLNSSNKAIGVLYGGGKTHVLALKGQYVTHVLKDIVGNQAISRKHVGIITELYSLDKAVKHRNFSQETMKEYITKYPDARNRVVVVKKVLAGSTAEGQIIPGDIIWKINGKDVAADLCLFDLELSKAKTDTVKISVIRNGAILEQSIKSYDLEKQKMSRMLDFAGGIFFEADDYVSLKSGIPIGKVTLANVQTGSSFSSIPEMFVQDYKSIYRLQINSINNTAIKTLDDLIKATKDAIKKKYVNLEYRNHQPHYPMFAPDSGFISSHDNLMQDIVFDSIESDPRILKYDSNAAEWVSSGL